MRCPRRCCKRNEAMCGGARAPQHVRLSALALTGGEHPTLQVSSHLLARAPTALAQSSAHSSTQPVCSTHARHTLGGLANKGRRSKMPPPCWACLASFPPPAPLAIYGTSNGQPAARGVGARDQSMPIHGRTQQGCVCMRARLTAHVQASAACMLPIAFRHAPSKHGRPRSPLPRTPQLTTSHIWRASLHPAAAPHHQAQAEREHDARGGPADLHNQGLALRQGRAREGSVPT